MKKSRIVIIIVLSLVLILVIMAGLLTVFVSSVQGSGGLGIFSNIDELVQVLGQCDTKDVFHTDKNLQGLVVQESCCKIVNYDNASYTVYAYVFESDDDAIEYFCRESGLSPGSLIGNYSSALNGDMISRTRYVAFMDNTAIYISGGGQKRFLTFTKFLFEAMPSAIWF